MHIPLPFFIINIKESNKLSDKNPQFNFKGQFRKILVTSFIFFVVVSILAISYDAFKEDVNPFLNEYLPGVVEVLENGAKESQVLMGKPYMRPMEGVK